MYTLQEILELPLKSPAMVFALVLLIILLSPVFLKKIKAPAIIGLVISGIIVGPYGLNLLEKNAAINLFSTIGLLYIMFIAGLELDFKQFKKEDAKGMWFGILTFSVPLCVGFPVCYYYLNYTFFGALLVAAMFATHTLVAYPIISNYNLSKNKAVAITVAGTIFTDTLVLLLLSVITNAAKNQLSYLYWIKLLALLFLFVAFLFFVMPKISDWFFRKFEKEKELHYVYSLFVVFFSASISELIGLEAIIGAFFAGLSLSRSISHGSILMKRIKFTGNALFIPFFLISIGMLVDLKVLVSDVHSLYLALVLTSVALITKWTAAYMTQKIVGLSSLQRKVMFGLSTSHAAATLAIILVGYKSGIIDIYTINATVILILVTCLIATLVTESAASKIAKAEGITVSEDESD